MMDVTVRLLEGLSYIFPFLPIIFLLVVYFKVSKKVKSEKDIKSVEFVKKMEEIDRINRELVSKAKAYNKPTNKAEKVGHSNQTEALNIETSAKDIVIDKGEGLTSLFKLKREMEDRSNDWLAGQLGYEKKAGRSKDLDIGFLHESSCDAEMLKLEHELSCEDKHIDSGNF